MNSILQKIWYEAQIGYNDQLVNEEALNKFATLLAQHLMDRMEPLYDVDEDRYIDDWDRGYNAGVQSSIDCIQELIKEIK